MPSSSTNWAFEAELAASYIGPVEAVGRPFQGGQATTLSLQSARGRFILKHLRDPQPLQTEQTVLQALPHSPLETLQAVAFFEHQGGFYSLQTQLEGQNLVQAIKAADAPTQRALVRSWGAALRIVHSWKPALDMRESSLESLEKTLLTTRKDEVIGFGPYKGWVAREVIAELEAQKSDIEPQIVFTHGDYCVPNALVRQGHVSGVVDWVTGRYADYRSDLAAAAWSLEYNLAHRDYLPDLLGGYGYSGTLEELRWFEGLWVLPC